MRWALETHLAQNFSTSKLKILGLQNMKKTIKRQRLLQLPSNPWLCAYHIVNHTKARPILSVWFCIERSLKSNTSERVLEFLHSIRSYSCLIQCFSLGCFPFIPTRHLFLAQNIHPVAYASRMESEWRRIGSWAKISDETLLLLYIYSDINQIATRYHSKKTSPI